MTLTTSRYTTLTEEHLQKPLSEISEEEATLVQMALLEKPYIWNACMEELAQKFLSHLAMQRIQQPALQK